MRERQGVMVIGACLAAAAAAACAAGGGVRNAGAPVPSAGPGVSSMAAAPAPPPAPAVVASSADTAAVAARRAAEDSSRAETLVRRGWAVLGRGRDSEAVGDFRAALGLWPRLARALAGLAMIEAKARDFPEALALADSAAALGDTDTYVAAFRGRFLASMGRCHQAVAILLPLVRAHPEWVAPTPELAYCLLGLRRAPEAVAVMQVAVGREPGAPPLQWALMEAFIQVQQLDSALAHAVYLKDHFPDNGLWYVETGRVLVLLGRLDEARIVFERGFQLRPGLTDSLPRIDPRAWEAVRAVRGISPQ